MTGHFRLAAGTVTALSPVAGSRSTLLFTREHEDDLANKSPRLDRLSVVLRTSLEPRTRYSGGQVFINHAPQAKGTLLCMTTAG